MESTLKYSDEKLLEALRPLLEPSMRKELIDYYKWQVNLSVFVLTFSVTLLSLLKSAPKHPYMLVVGWVALAICIFFNWLLVKRIVSIPLAFSTPAEFRTILHTIFFNSLSLIKLYGNVQNWAFLLGTAMVTLALVLGLFGRGGGG